MGEEGAEYYSKLHLGSLRSFDEKVVIHREQLVVGLPPIICQPCFRVILLLRQEKPLFIYMDYWPFHEISKKIRKRSVPAMSATLHYSK